MDILLKKADLMFVQHMIAVLKADGKMAVVMPHGVLFRGGEEKTARKKIIEQQRVLEQIQTEATKIYKSISIETTYNRWAHGGSKSQGTHQEQHQHQLHGNGKNLTTQV